MKIQKATSKGPANFPFLVQHQNTENWNTDSAHKTESEAIARAGEIASKYPKLPVRVLHCTGGPIKHN